jgi:predicted AAA+ superfamily ATPase
MTHIKRFLEDPVKKLLNQFPCVAVLGARQIGKTTLLKNVRPKAPFYDLEKQATFQTIKEDPDFFLSNVKEPIVIDEAQLLPSLFPALRVRIDQERDRKGLFLISGSSSPDLLKRVSESLAGRIMIVELSGFSVQETWGLSPSPFYEILKSRRFNELEGLAPRATSGQLSDSWFFGGYPEPLLRRLEPNFVSLWMDSYFQTYIKRDIRDLFPGLNTEAYQNFIHMLASSSGEMINASEWARSLSVSQPTVRNYLRIAEGTFLWRTLPSYSQDVEKRVMKTPKGHLRDAGLMHFLLRLRDSKDLHHHPRAGRMWEAFIAEEIIKELKNRFDPGDFFHYRTQHQAEIDLILQGDFGLVPIEIKLGTKTDGRQLAALRTFVEERRLPIGLVINNAERPEWLAPKILQVPAACL